MNNLDKLLKNGRILSKDILKTFQQKSSELLSNAQLKGLQAKKLVNIPIKDRLNNSVKFVDEALGVSQVAEAQYKVSVQEHNFLTSRDDVQQLKMILEEQQDILNETRKKLDRCDRSDESYLSYVAEEHKLLLEVKKLQRDYNTAEEIERQKFLVYSSAVRLSHEKERSRAERTKYWSIIGSVTGTVIGFMFSSLLTQYRLTRIKEMTASAITEATANVRGDIDKQKKDLLDRFNPKNTTLVGEPVQNLIESIESLGNALQDSYLNFGDEFEETVKLMNNQLDSLEKQISTTEHDFQINLKNTLKDLERNIYEINKDTKHTLDGFQLTLSRDLNNKFTSLKESGQLELTEAPEVLNLKSMLTEYITVQNVNVILTIATLGFVLVNSFSRT